MTVDGAVVGSVGLLIGLGLTFSGYRFFLLLLPFWGFVAGFLGGAQAVSVLLGHGFLSTPAGWGAAIFLGLGLAVSSILWYWLAVVMLGAGIGWALGQGAAALAGITDGVAVFIAGLAGALVIAAGTIVLRLPKVLVVVMTAVGGSVLVVAGVLLLFGIVPVDDFRLGMAGAVIRHSSVWLVAWLILAVAGLWAQLESTAAMEEGIRADAYRYG